MKTTNQWFDGAYADFHNKAGANISFPTFVPEYVAFGGNGNAAYPSFHNGQYERKMALTLIGSSPKEIPEYVAFSGTHSEGNDAYVAFHNGQKEHTMAMDLINLSKESTEYVAFSQPNQPAYVAFHNGQEEHKAAMDFVGLSLSFSKANPDAVVEHTAFEPKKLAANKGLQK